MEELAKFNQLPRELRIMYERATLTRSLNVNRWRQCKRRDFIRRVRKLGFERPVSFVSKIFANQRPTSCLFSRKRL